MRPRIYLHPGYIISKNDGDKHYIGAGQLASLYDVPLSKCTVVDDYRYPNKANYDNGVNAYHLYPRDGGDYYSLRLKLAIEKLTNGD